MSEPMRPACEGHATGNAPGQCGSDACGHAMRNATVRNGTERHETARIQDPGITPRLPYAPGPVDKGFQRGSDEWKQSDAEFAAFLESASAWASATPESRRRVLAERARTIPGPDITTTRRR